MSEAAITADIVESFLLGVLTDPPRREASFTFRPAAAGGRQFRLLARGVDHLRVDEFKHQNIVQEVNVVGPASDPERIRDLLATLMFDAVQASDVVEGALKEKLVECANAVLAGHKVLLEISPVYGASVLLLGASLEWLDGDDVDPEFEK
jgi:hypothetical protein